MTMIIQDEVNRVAAIAENYKFHKFQVIAPIVSQLDSMWTFVCTFYYPNSSKVMKSHFLGRSTSKEEIQIFCDLNKICLDEN